MPDELKLRLENFGCSGLFLHASSVIVSGDALLFLGYSNAGKSTISKLLSKRYPQIADDKVCVYKKRGKWMARGLIDSFHPLNGNSRQLRSEQYPLRAIIRIFKSNKVQIKRISQLTTCRHLMDSVFEIDFQRKMFDLNIRKKWFCLTAKISREIEGWELTFAKDESTIYCINSVFEKKY